MPGMRQHLWCLIQLIELCKQPGIQHKLPSARARVLRCSHPIDAAIASQSRQTRHGQLSYPASNVQATPRLTFTKCSVGHQGHCHAALHLVRERHFAPVHRYRLCIGQIDTVPVHFMNMARALLGPDVREYWPDC
ncbi:uncharacterized protein LAESUDRAFT_77588 [Laetiporus sulphureus 93-53]|uniref:Uncharacterized protein n=1 Tax=Laetiporus sulphureus 93-53 TaxID=1314785 RepID=A0A165F136_9APHY|nr:uncharacterized protein LAESUDRAFT_77588 [Laetiporus sulphureus 93-53]KZT08144.1 hypothetical protein LAESUDRAFT_77588 [Laetiporus sulphureus 93-53]